MDLNTAFTPVRPSRPGDPQVTVHARVLATIWSGKLLTTMPEAQKGIETLMGSGVMTHQIPAAMEVLRPHVERHVAPLAAIDYEFATEAGRDKMIAAVMEHLDQLGDVTLPEAFPEERP